MKTIGYLRVSSDGQAENGFGLDVQRERIEAYAKALGLVIDDFIVDDGYSGTTLDRPGLTDLLGRIARGEVNRVIVYKIDRFSRSQRRLLELIEDHFVANDVAFVSVTEQFDTSTPFGRACLGMLGVFAQLDRDMVVERLASGRKARAATGERAVGAVPYGYRVEGEGRNKRTVVDPHFADVIRYIFSRRDRDGASFQTIAYELIGMDVKPKRGKSWYASTVRGIYENQKYRGVVMQTVAGEVITQVNRHLALI